MKRVCVVKDFCRQPCAHKKAHAISSHCLDVCGLAAVIDVDCVLCDDEGNIAIKCVECSKVMNGATFGALKETDGLCVGIVCKECLRKIVDANRKAVENGG